MSRRAGTTNAGPEETAHDPKNNSQEKQAMLLAQDTGHFSMIRYGQPRLESWMGLTRP